MPRNNRRSFLKRTSATVVAASIARSAPASSVNEQIVMGAVGCGGQGTFLLRSFARQPEARLAFVCDADEGRANAAAVEVEKISGKRPAVVTDLRKVLDDKSVEAITVATPDHWHGPAAILACEAGKHVYVEKPCSHNVREGRLMVEAARRNKRIVQVGMQSRSAAHVQRAVELIRNKAIGEVLIAKAWNSQRRSNIGHAKPSEPPAGFDYDLWVGPAPMVPFQSNRHHYNWHWWYDFGTGDAGNDGVHELDIARWGLGVESHPTTIAAVGGKFFFDDDQQFPDTEYVSFSYPGDGKVGQRKQLVFEMRIWSPYRQEGYENGNAFYGTEGMMIVGKNDGLKVYGPRNKLIEEMPAKGMGEPHHRNFLECIRTGKLPNADIEIGHYSAALCHLGNIASRIGRQLTFDGQREGIANDAEANALVRRAYRDGHWAVPKGV